MAVLEGVAIVYARSRSGIALEFVLDEGGEFEIGELQQLDRLQQLGRHHQGLSLTHDELR